jgi:uncharacterized membrane protein
MDALAVLGVLFVLVVIVGSIFGLAAFIMERELSNRVSRLENEIRELRQARPQPTWENTQPTSPQEEVRSEPHEQAPTPPLGDAESGGGGESENLSPPAEALDSAASVASGPIDLFTISKPEERKPDPVSLEERIGTRWAVWVGGLALGLGGVFLVRYSIEAGLLGPAARVLLGLVFSAALFAGSEWLRTSGFAETTANRRAYVPGVLAAAGAISAFASVYAAYGLYGLIGPALAFIALGAVGVATLGLALRHGPGLAGLGLVAAYATPLLVSSAEPALLPLIIYLAVVTIATYAVARIRLWRWLAIAGTVGNVLWSLLLAGSGVANSSDPTSPFYLAAHFLISLALAAVVFVTSHAPGDRTADAPFDRTATIVLSLFTLPLIVAASALGGDAVAIILTIAHAVVLLALASEWPAARGLAVTALVATVLAYAVFGVTLADSIIDPVTGEPVVPGFAYLLASDDGGRYIGIGVFFGLVLTLAGLAGALKSRGRPQLSITGAFAAPGLITFAYIGTSKDLAVSPGFAVAALIAAGYLLSVTEYLGRRLAADTRGRDGAIAAYAVGTIATLGVAFTIAFEKGMLTVTLALLVAAIAWVEARRPVAALRPTAVALAAVVVARFIWDPRVVGDDLGTTVLFNPLLYGYGVPTLAFAYAAWRFGKTEGNPRFVPVFEALAVVFTALTVTLEIHHAMNGGDLFAPVSGLAEQSLITMAFLAISLGLNWLSVRRVSKVLSWGTPIFGGLGLLMAAIGLLFVNNPVFTGEAITGGSFDGTLFVGYVPPAVMALLVAFIANRRPDQPRRYMAIAGSVGCLLLGMWATLAVRAGWHSGDLSWGDVAEGELYAYSAVWLVFGLAVLGVGVVMATRAVRMVAAAIVMIVVAKVFLFDTAGLTGALRALSFIGLGAVLVAVGLGYQLVLRKR